MASIVVVCDRWLGLAARYIVRIDGREVGRLGRRSKRVVVAVDAGRHSVLVDYNGRTTPTKDVEVGHTGEVCFELIFPYSYAAVFMRGLNRPPFGQPAFPRGVTDIMALVQAGTSETE